MTDTPERDEIEALFLEIGRHIDVGNYYLRDTRAFSELRSAVAALFTRFEAVYQAQLNEREAATTMIDLLKGELRAVEDRTGFTNAREQWEAQIEVEIEARRKSERENAALTERLRQFEAYGAPDVATMLDTRQKLSEENAALRERLRITGPRGCGHVESPEMIELYKASLCQSCATKAVLRAEAAERRLAGAHAGGCGCQGVYDLPCADPRTGIDPRCVVLRAGGTKP